MDEGIGLKWCLLHRPLAAGTPSIFRTGGGGAVDLKGRRKQVKKVDEDEDDMFKFDCGRTESTLWENPSYLNKKMNICE